MLTREQLAKEAQQAATAVMTWLIERHGRTMAVMVWLAEFGEETTAYASNVDAKDLGRALREMADRLEVGLTSDPPGDKAQG